MLEQLPGGHPVLVAVGEVAGDRDLPAGLEGLSGIGPRAGLLGGRGCGGDQEQGGGEQRESQVG